MKTLALRHNYCVLEAEIDDEKDEGRQIAQDEAQGVFAPKLSIVVFVKRWRPG
jgi:hypothetical protein